MLSAQERKAREKALQDERFALDDGSRGGTGGAYWIVGASHGYYRRRLTADAPGKRMLEIGCGRGETTLELARCGARATGIDLSDVAAENARAQSSEFGLAAEFIAMDAEAMTFPPRSFDIVCGGAILHHLDIRKAYAEIARVLCSDGYALFLEPLGHNPIINVYRRITPHLRTPDEHPLVAGDLALARQYFGVVDVTYYYLTALLTLPVARTKGGRAITAIANAVDRLLFWLAPALRKFAWYTVIELREPKSYVP